MKCQIWILFVYKRKAEKMLEEPTEVQGRILKSFGYGIEKGVLQKLYI